MSDLIQVRIFVPIYCICSIWTYNEKNVVIEGAGESAEDSM
jgi:hypothetical protein